MRINPNKILVYMTLYDKRTIKDNDRALLIVPFESIYREIGDGN
jgi:hypothetical protein